MSAPPSDADPLILTAAFDPAAARVFQSMRDHHFPAKLNIVPAHMTLFHKLPGSELDAIDARLREACAGEAAMAFTTTGLRFLGRGVALEVQSQGLSALRGRLAEGWRPWLGPQDAQSFRPHVTVQNKADPAEARALRDRLTNAFDPVSGTIVGLILWHYRGGPWERAGFYGMPA